MRTTNLEGQQLDNEILSRVNEKFERDGCYVEKTIPNKGIFMFLSRLCSVMLFLMFYD